MRRLQRAGFPSDIMVHVLSAFHTLSGGRRQDLVSRLPLSARIENSKSRIHAQS